MKKKGKPVLNQELDAEKPKKPLWKKWWFWIVVFFAVVILYSLIQAAIYGPSEASEPSPSPSPSEVVEAVSEQPAGQQEAQELEVSEQETPEPRENPLDAIALSKEDKIKVFLETKSYLNSDENPGNSIDGTAEETEAYENAVFAGVAENYGISAEDVENIFLYASFGYLYDYDPSAVTVPHGEVLEANVTDTTLIVKAKITSNLTNQMTIDQNYYNVCDIIRNQDGAQFETVSYWAVADMQDGSEGKVISFDIPKDVLERVANTEFPDNTLGEYVENLWILPSLLS